MELDISSHKGKSGPRINAHGQVKTSRNCPRPKPPLPIKKKVTEGPLRRSSRQKQIRENMVVYFSKVFERSIPQKRTIYSKKRHTN